MWIVSEKIINITGFQNGNKILEKRWKFVFKYAFNQLLRDGLAVTQG